MTKSTDYHDYVFRDGKLVGEFEEMYRNSATVPWHQDKQETWVDVRLTRELLRDFGQYHEIHDLGCGTGHYLELIARDFLLTGGRSYGYDISPTACKLAKQLFPQSEFNTLDLTIQHTTHNTQHTTHNTQQNLFMIRGTLWYVFPKLSCVINNIHAMLKHNDKLLVVQNFPPLQKSFVGKEVIPNHCALVQHFSYHFSLIRHIWYEDNFKQANDNWFIGLFSSKE